MSYLITYIQPLCAVVVYCECCFSAEAEFSSHHREAKQVVQSLCSFVAKKAELAKPTGDYLVHYVKVVDGVSDAHHSVDCVLFTGKQTNGRVIDNQ